VTGGRNLSVRSAKQHIMHVLFKVACLLALEMCCHAGVGAAEEGMTNQGRRYVSGGVSEEERVLLHAQRERYSLWIVTAARGSGAYLSDERVKVADSDQRVVFDASLDGPWLLIDLPPGRYAVEAHFGSETQRQATTVHPGDHHQTFLRFDVDADVLPRTATTEMGTPFNGAR
jgi:hypothetical protein